VLSVAISYRWAMGSRVVIAYPSPSNAPRTAAMQLLSDSTSSEVGTSKQSCVFTVFHHLPTSSSSPHFVWGSWVAHPRNCLPTAQVRRQTFQFPTNGDAVLRMQTGPGSMRLSPSGKDICTTHVASSGVMATRVRNVWGNVAMRSVLL